MPNGVASILPHTRKLLDPRYLLGAAILSRLAVGISRCIVDYPRKNGAQSPDGNQPLEPYSHKVTSFEERIFMELLGLPVHVGGMQLIQDGLSGVLQKTPWLQKPSLDYVKQFAKLTGAESEAIQHAFSKLSSQNPIAKAVYSPSEFNAGLKGVLGDALSHLKAGGSSAMALRQPVEKALTQSMFQWQQRVRGASAISLVAGIVGAAIFSGAMWQRINDSVFSKRVIPRVNKLFGWGKDNTTQPEVVTESKPKATARFASIEEPGYSRPTAMAASYGRSSLPVAAMPMMNILNQPPIPPMLPAQPIQQPIQQSFQAIQPFPLPSTLPSYGVAPYGRSFVSPYVSQPYLRI